MNPKDFSEQRLVEDPALGLLDDLGYEVVHAFTEEFGEGVVAKGAPGRDNQSEVILRHRLRPKLAALNPDLPHAALEGALEDLTADRSAMDRVRANQAVWKLLRHGARVTFVNRDGDRVIERVDFIDWSTPTNNEFLVVNQLLDASPARPLALAR